jgi:hypothetical protein
MSKHQAYIPGSTEVEGHVHEQDTWSPADWDLAQIALVCLGGIIVFLVIPLFVGGCKHANCRKVGNYEKVDDAGGEASTGESTSNMESLSLSSEL